MLCNSPCCLRSLLSLGGSARADYVARWRPRRRSFTVCCFVAIFPLLLLCFVHILCLCVCQRSAKVNNWLHEMVGLLAFAGYTLFRCIIGCAGRHMLLITLTFRPFAVHCVTHYYYFFPGSLPRVPLYLPRIHSDANVFTSAWRDYDVYFYMRRRLPIIIVIIIIFADFGSLPIKEAQISRSLFLFFHFRFHFFASCVCVRSFQSQKQFNPIIIVSIWNLIDYGCLLYE